MQPVLSQSVAATDLVALTPDVVVAPLNAAALAVRRLSSELPIVFVLGIDPVGVGLASNLARPGRNTTGLAVAGPETAAKRLQILRELAPQSRRIGVIGNAAVPGYPEVRTLPETAAATLGVRMVDATVAGTGDLEPALARLTAERASGTAPGWWTRSCAASAPRRSRSRC